MRRYCWGALFLMAAAGPAAAAEDAQAVLNWAVAARGGWESLAKYPAAHWQGRGTLFQNGAAAAFAAEWYRQPPERGRSTLTVQAGPNQRVTVTTIITAKDGWQVIGDQRQPLSPAKLADARAQQYLEWVTKLTPLRDPAFTLTVAGEGVVAERPAIAMKVQHAGQPEVTLFLDKATGLLAKLRTTLPDPATGKPVEHVTVFSEYRDVAGYGLKWPMRVTTWRDGQPFVETEVTNVRPLETLAEDVLTRP